MAGQGKYNTGGDEGNMMYDDNAFQLFLVALLASFWIPTTLFRLVRLIRRATHTKTALEEAKDAWCPCAACQQKKDTLEAKTRGPRAFSFGTLVYIVVTVVLLFMSVKVYRVNLTAEPPFDPFSILAVHTSATPKEIKKAYRRLSVLHHPDKNRDDPNAGDRFIKITKAYAALTDEATMENYVKYGNPDGYMGTTLGLGLPEWVAESRNGVLLAYFAFIVIFFPTVVGVWWRKRSLQLTSEIMTSTFMLYRETLQQTTKFRDLLAAFCGSYEFRGLYNSDNDEDLGAIVDTLKRSGKDMKRTRSVVEPEPFQVQNFHVMTAYLCRVPISKKLDYIREEILRRCDALLTAMTDTVGAFQRPDCQAAWPKTFMHGHTVYLATCLSVTQCVIQALDEKSSPFLQIPHFTEREVRYCAGSRAPTIRTIYDFMKLDMAGQRKILRDFSDQQYLDVKAFLDRFPSANLDVSDPIVEGEDNPAVHAGDTVTIRAKLTIMRRSGSAFSPHTPHLPFRKEEAWWIWLADERLLCPLEVRRLMPRMAVGHDPQGERRKKDPCCGGDDHDDDEHMDETTNKLTSDPRVTIFDVKFTFQAPIAGDYNLEVRMACDCYKGASKAKVIKMKVAKEIVPPPQSDVKYFDTDDESESEEEESSEAEETEGEYEYIEVTDDESESGDFDEEGESDDEDPYGIVNGASGNPTS